MEWQRKKQADFNESLRSLLSFLWDESPEALNYLLRIRAFYCKKENRNRELQSYAWLAKNKIIGKKLIEFFEEEGNFLSGMNKMINRIDGRKYSLNRIMYDECL